MLKIDLLKNHPHTIPALAKIWQNELGQGWMPGITLEEIISLYYEELYQEMPVTYVALQDEIPMGSCTLELHAEICPHLSPWIGDLVIDGPYQGQGIGTMLLVHIMRLAKERGFDTLYLYTFDAAVAPFYQRLGWTVMSREPFNHHEVLVMSKGLVSTP
ncbi:TPA: GNAT family N-acetyltransferase [Legionella pneumophila]